jgi:hypothetical protein
MKPIKHFEQRNIAGMSIHAEVLLDLIHSLDKPTVMKIIDTAIIMEIATRNTLHKSLMWLKHHSFIMIDRREEDSREKMCILTRKGINYLEKI